MGRCQNLHYMATENDDWREKIELENFRLLIDHISGENKLFWDRFNIFTVLNSALLSVSFLDQVTNDAIAILSLSFFGIALSVLWFFIMARTRAYMKHWTALAREIEESKLKELLQTHFGMDTSGSIVLQRSWRG